MRLPPPRSALLNKNQAATFMSHEAKPENLIGDRAYDSDPLDEELRNDGIEMTDNAIQ